MIIIDDIDVSTRKGILDVGYTIGTGDFGLDRVGASTSHGIQCGKNILKKTYKNFKNINLNSF